MRRLLAASAAFGLVIALGSSAWAQDKNRTEKQTVRGVVAGVTAEGEMAIDYRTNKAVLVEAAYLTVVGSPVDGQGHTANVSTNPKDSERREKGQNRGDHPDQQRDNVYIVWISPETKVYEASGDSGKIGTEEAGVAGSARGRRPRGDRAQPSRGDRRPCRGQPDRSDAPHSRAESHRLRRGQRHHHPPGKEGTWIAVGLRETRTQQVSE